MARYHFLAEGKKVSEEGFLGPLMGNLKIAPTVLVENEHVKVSWGHLPKLQYVVIDTKRCKVLEHSNSAAPLPAISKCTNSFAVVK
ncbi:MAG: hypothetical protein IPK77_16895 [Cellvibrio sp.]|nr:hypothetical protein [Cellvibrio sp.]